MATINEMVDEHNKLAKKLGKPILNSWKQDKVKLQGRIDKLLELDNDLQITRDTPVPGSRRDRMLPKNGGTVRLGSNKSASQKYEEELIEKEAKRAELSKNQINVVIVAEEINMDPKVARAKLRRKGLKANEGRWPTFTRGSSEHKDMIKLLKGSEK